MDSTNSPISTTVPPAGTCPIPRGQPGSKADFWLWCRLYYTQTGVDVCVEVPGFEHSQIQTTVVSNRYLRVHAENSDAKRDFDFDLKEYQVDTRRTTASLELGILRVCIYEVEGTDQVFRVPWVSQPKPFIPENSIPPGMLPPLPPILPGMYGNS